MTEKFLQEVEQTREKMLEVNRQAAEELARNPFGGLLFWFNLAVLAVILTILYYVTWWPLEKLTHGKDWLLGSRDKIEIPLDLSTAVTPEEARLLATLHYELRRADVLDGTVLFKSEAKKIREKLAAAETAWREGRK